MSFQLPTFGLSENAWLLVVGLLGGWLLGGLTHVLKSRSDKKQRLSRALATLYMMRGSGQAHDSIARNFRNGSQGLEESERYRQRSLFRMERTLASLEPHLSSLLETVMDYLPSHIGEFHSLIELTRAFPSLKLSASSQASDKLYLLALSHLEVGAEVQREVERKAMLRIASAIGPVTYVQTLLSLRSEKDSTDDDEHSLIHEAMEEARKAINPLQNAKD